MIVLLVILAVINYMPEITLLIEKSFEKLPKHSV